MISRRQFVKSVPLILAASSWPTQIHIPRKKLTLGTLIPENLPFLTRYQRDVIETLSQNGFQLEVLSRTQTMERFDGKDESFADSHLDMVFSVPFNWRKFDSAFLLLSANRMAHKDLKKWLNSSSGFKVWDSLYGNLEAVAVPFGDSGPHIGHWHSKPVNSENPYSNSTVNMFHLNSQVAELMNGTYKSLPVSSVVSQMASGELSVFEWQGPYLDSSLGLSQIGAVCYSSYWHCPSEAPVIQFQLVSRLSTWKSLSTAVRDQLNRIAAKAESELHSTWLKADLATVENLKKTSTILQDFPIDFEKRLKDTRALEMERVAQLSSKKNLASEILRITC